MPEYPSFPEVQAHARAAGAALRAAGVGSKIVDAIKTKATLTARKRGGSLPTNREARWLLPTDNPQYGTELDCHIILVKLAAQIFCFDNAPVVPILFKYVPDNVKALGPHIKSIMEERYLGHEICPNTFRDSLLLERFDFNDLVAEGLTPVHGHSSFHIGHEDPSRQPRHVPDNTQWRTYRSNMIQGSMTLPQARLYFVKMIARYFDLGEIQIIGEAAPEAVATAEATTEDGTLDD